MKDVGMPADVIGFFIGFSLGIANGEFDFETSDLEQVLGRKTQNAATLLKEMYQ